MDLALLVYGISVLGKFLPTLGIIVGFTIAALVISLIYRFAALGIESWDSAVIVKQKMEARVPLEKWIKRFFILLGITSLVAIATPSEKTAYMMVGAYATQKVAENEKVQETGKKVLTLIEQKLDKYIEEGLEEAAKGSKNGNKKKD